MSSHIFIRCVSITDAMSRKAKNTGQGSAVSRARRSHSLASLSLMGAGEICVCFLVEILKTNQPKISRHLAYLRRAGIVDARREGQWMHYYIVEPDDADAGASSERRDDVVSE